MRVNKAVFFALAVAGLSAQLPATASGNAHKYPVTVPKEVPKEVTKEVSKDADRAKPVEPLLTKPNEPVQAKPADATAAKATEPVTPKPTEATGGRALSGLGLPFVIVSRYEPLSGRDSREVVPDLNRGHGKGK